MLQFVKGWKPPIAESFSTTPPCGINGLDGKGHLSYADTMVVELTVEQEQQLRMLAAANGSTPEALALEIITWALQDRLALAQELEEAREDLAAGRVFTTEQVLQRVRKMSEAA